MDPACASASRERGRDRVQAAGVVAASLAAAAALVVRTPVARAAAMLGALVLAVAVLLGHVWSTDQVETLRDDPRLTAMLVVVGARGGRPSGVAASRGAPRCCRRSPPRRCRSASRSTSAATPRTSSCRCTSSWRPAPSRTLVRAARDPDAEERRPGALEWALAAVLVLYAVQATYSSDARPGAGARRLLLRAVRRPVRAARARARGRRAWPRGRSAVLVVLAVALVGVGFWEYATKQLLLNPRVINSNQFESYFRVNSLFFDPNIYGRFLVVVMIGVAAVVAWTARSRTALAGAVAARAAVGRARADVLAVVVRRAARRARGARRVPVGRRRGRSRATGAVAVVGDRGRAARARARCDWTSGSDKSVQDATSGRYDLVAGGVRLFSEKPVGGFGSGSFRREYRRSENASAERATNASHTIPVTVAAEQGVDRPRGVPRARRGRALAAVRGDRPCGRLTTARGRGGRRVRGAARAHAPVRRVPGGSADVGAARARDRPGGRGGDPAGGRRSPSRAVRRDRARRRRRRSSPPRSCGGCSSRAIRTTTPTTTSSGGASCSTGSSRPSRRTRRRRSIRSTSRYAALVGLAGEDADRLLVLTTLLCLVALVWGTWRLGARALRLWPALLATLFVGSSFAFLLYAVRAYVDVPFLALVVWAAVREVERHGAAPRACSCSPGCCGPRAGSSRACCGCGAGRRGHRAARAGRAARPRRAGGLVPRRPRRHRQPAALGHRDELARRGPRPRAGHRRRCRGCSSRSSRTSRGRRSRSAGVIGAVLAVRRVRRSRRMAIPLGDARGRGARVHRHRRAGPVDPARATSRSPRSRSASSPGYAVAGLHAPARRAIRWRRPWGAAAVGAPVVGAVFFVVKLAELRDARRRAALRPRRARRPARAARHARGPRRAWRCGPITFPNYRLVPDTRWMLDAPRTTVGARSAKRPRPRGRRLHRGARDAAPLRVRRRREPAHERARSGLRAARARGRLSAYSACRIRADDPELAQPLPQRRVLALGGLRERPRAQLGVRAARACRPRRAARRRMRRGPAAVVTASRPGGDAGERRRRPSGGRAARTSGSGRAARRR